MNVTDKSLNTNTEGKPTVPELLAPAGSSKALVAAVQSGADAVYLGLSSFNARASAENFTLDNLPQWVVYAHLRGVKIHVTLNTLLKNEELDKAIELALRADEIGVDAFIVQDLGLASRLSALKKTMNAELHASTQATVYNEHGLVMMKELGFDRAVLARELPICEIKRLASLNIIDTETFCHGALCISYSGQCMLSRFAGGRSGNRGTCAQPCRLNYRLEEKRNDADGRNGTDNRFENLLSPADLCSLPYIEELIDTGVSSLKIEGRLKSPEYVAAVTRAYRRVLDDPSSFREKDVDELAVVFSRGGFCSGHQKGKMPISAITREHAGKTGLYAGVAVGNARKVKGPVSLFEIDVKCDKPLCKGDGISFYGEAQSGGVINVIRRNGKVTDNATDGETVSLLVAGNAPFFKGGRGGRGAEEERRFYKTYDEALYRELKKYVEPKGEQRKVPLSAVFAARGGEKATFTLTDPEGRSVTALSDSEALEAGGERGLCEPDAKEKLCGFGNTPFEIASFECIIDGNVFMNFSELKSLRRKATDLLIAARTEVKK